MFDCRQKGGGGEICVCEKFAKREGRVRCVIVCTLLRTAGGGKMCRCGQFTRRLGEGVRCVVVGSLLGGWGRG